MGSVPCIGVTQGVCSLILTTRCHCSLPTVAESRMDRGRNSREQSGKMDECQIHLCEEAWSVRLTSTMVRWNMTQFTCEISFSVKLFAIFKYTTLMFLHRHAHPKKIKKAGTYTLVHLPFSVMITSVWELPYLCIWSTASCMLSTTSIQHSRSPYSVRNELASDGLNVR